MNFIQNGAIPGNAFRAFNFMIATSNTTFTELVRINKNGDMIITGNTTTPTLNATTSIISPTITDINTNIATINSNISNVNNTSDMDKPVSNAQQIALDLKADTTTLNNYALLNSSPTFSGNVKSQVYSGNVVKYDSSVSMNFTPTTLPSTIVVDGFSNLALYGIPNMPIGTRFTVIKTNTKTQLYSTDNTVFFYSNRKFESWDTYLTINEDARTFIRIDLTSKVTGNPLKVWMTESSHTYNMETEIKRQSIGAWMLDGPDYGRTAGTYRPIICSNKVFGPGNSDDGFLVNPGYKLIIYAGENYTGTATTIDNTLYGFDVVSNPLHHSSSPVNDMQSVRLYYNNVEIVFSGIS